MMFKVTSGVSPSNTIYRLSLRLLSHSPVLSAMPVRDTTTILSGLRRCMKDRKYVQEPLQAYIVPSCDAHNSEYLADVDARREALSGFTGSAGTAIVTQKQVCCCVNFFNSS